MGRLATAVAVLLWSTAALAVDIAPQPGVTDYGPVIQQAIDSLVDTDGVWPDESGGVINFAKGRYPVATGVTIACPGILIRGVGSHKSFACVIEWVNSDPGAALFTFRSDVDRSKRAHGFRMQNIKLRGKKAGVAFRFAKHDAYSHDYLFGRVSATYFAKVFEVRKGKVRLIGGPVCNNCSFTYNGQVVDATEGAFNEFRFRDCQFHKNGLATEGWGPTYAFDFKRGSDGLFDGCILENQPRALRVRNFQNLRVVGCRFEGNTNAYQSDPVVLVEDSCGVWFDANFHRLLKAEHGPNVPPTILLRNCRGYRVSPMLGRVHIERDWGSRE